MDIFCTYSLWLPHSPHCKHQIGCFSSYSLVSKRNTEKPNAKAVMQNIPCEMQLFYIFQLFIFVYILVHFAWLIFRKLQMEKVFELRNNCTAKAFWAEASYIYIPHNRKCVTLCVAEIFFVFLGIFYSREISTRTEQNKATSALIECMIFGVRLRISQANTKSLRFSGVGFVLLLYNSNSNSNSPFCTSSSNTFVDTI